MVILGVGSRWFNQFSYFLSLYALPLSKGSLQVRDDDVVGRFFLTTMGDVLWLVYSHSCWGFFTILLQSRLK